MEDGGRRMKAKSMAGVCPILTKWNLSGTRSRLIVAVNGGSGWTSSFTADFVRIIVFAAIGTAMKLTQSERRLIKLENSYRVQRTIFTVLSVWSALPLLHAMGTVILWMFKFRNRLNIILDAMLEVDWSQVYPALAVLLSLCFLAYRAQSKLTLIDYLKRNGETQCSELAAAPNGDPATR